jgi:hypothetical protein
MRPCQIVTDSSKKLPDEKKLYISVQITGVFWGIFEKQLTISVYIVHALCT